MSYIEGTVVRFTTDPSVKGAVPFTSISGTIVDPDVVVFEYSVQGQTVVSYTWTNPTGDPTGHIINAGVGIYYIDVDTTGLPGTWTWGWSCNPSSGIDVTAAQVVWEGETVISPASL